VRLQAQVVTLWIESVWYSTKFASTALQLVMRLANKILLGIVLRQIV